MPAENLLYIERTLKRAYRSLLAVSILVSTCTNGCKKAPPKLVYVSTEDGGEIVAVDPERGEVALRIPVGKRPRGVKISPDGKFLYVALSGSPRAGPNHDESTLPPADHAADGIGVVDLATRKLVRTLSSGQDPESFDLSLDGKTLYVSNEETAELSVLDLTSGNLVKKVPVGKEPEGVTVRPDGKLVYVTCEDDAMVVAIDTATLTAVARIPTGQRPRSIVFSRDASTAFVTNEQSGTLTMFDPGANKPIGTIKLEAGSKGGPPRPMGATLSTNGKVLFVSTGRGGSVSVVDVAQGKAVAVIDEVGARPWGIATSSDGRWLFTANGSSNDLSVVDVATGQVMKRVNVGGLPWGVAVAPAL